MKKINQIKLNYLSDAILSAREESMLIGGNNTECCGCGCNYTATTIENRDANSRKGYGQSAGGNKTCVEWYDKNENGTYDPKNYNETPTC